MNAQQKALSSLFIVFAGLGLMSPATSAQPFEENLRGTSIPEVVDYNTRINSFYKDAGVLGDTKFTFGVGYSDNMIRKVARQTEALYLDLIQQQDDDYPIVRTRDLPSPFTTSIYTLQSPASFSQFGELGQ